jgi:hypothetical protein
MTAGYAEPGVPGLTKRRPSRIFGN